VAVGRVGQGQTALRRMCGHFYGLAGSLALGVLEARVGDEDIDDSTPNEP